MAKVMNITEAMQAVMDGKIVYSDKYVETIYFMYNGTIVYADTSSIHVRNNADDFELEEVMADWFIYEQN